MNYVVTTCMTIQLPVSSWTAYMHDIHKHSTYSSKQMLLAARVRHKEGELKLKKMVNTKTSLKFFLCTYFYILKQGSFTNNNLKRKKKCVLTQLLLWSSLIYKIFDG